MKISIPGFNGTPYTINLKKLIFPILLLIIVLIIFFKVSELQEIGRLFSQIKWYLLIVIFVSQVVNLGLQARTYYTIFKILNFPYINFFKLMKISLVMIFLDYTIPSYGVAGNIYLLKFLTKRGFKEGRVLLMIILHWLKRDLMKTVSFYNGFMLINWTGLHLPLLAELLPMFFLIVFF